MKIELSIYFLDSIGYPDSPPIIQLTLKTTSVDFLTRLMDSGIDPSSIKLTDTSIIISIAKTFGFKVDGLEHIKKLKEIDSDKLLELCRQNLLNPDNIAEQLSAEHSLILGLVSLSRALSLSLRNPRDSIGWASKEKKTHQPKLKVQKPSIASGLGTRTSSLMTFDRTFAEGLFGFKSKTTVPSVTKIADLLQLTKPLEMHGTNITNLFSLLSAFKSDGKTALEHRNTVFRVIKNDSMVSQELKDAIRDMKVDKPEHVRLVQAQYDTNPFIFFTTEGMMQTHRVLLADTLDPVFAFCQESPQGLNYYRLIPRQGISVEEIISYISDEIEKGNRLPCLLRDLEPKEICTITVAP